MKQMRKVLAISGAALWSAAAASACQAATPGPVFAQAQAAVPFGRYWMDAVIVGVLFGAALTAICMSSRRL
ncbi:MAG TPA: hypothetical protein VHB77_07720 [Planctomycetaceae bacterium]|nr:hypothetical protein [Planctomycetaceae bacterium]